MSVKKTASRRDRLKPAPTRSAGLQFIGVLLAVVALAPAPVLARQNQSQPDAAPPEGKALGMSIVGNQEAPKALVIVPWKRSELGNVLGISTLLDDSRLPIDKEVFMRMLSYYEIRSETARPGGAPAKTNAAQPASAAPRRKP